MKLKANAPHKPWHYYYRKKGLQRAMVGYLLLMPCFIVWMLLAGCSENISHDHPAHKQEMSRLHNGETAEGPSLLNLFIHHQHSHRHMTFSITISAQNPYLEEESVSILFRLEITYLAKLISDNFQSVDRGHDPRHGIWNDPIC